MPKYAQNNPLRSIADYEDQYARADANALALQQGRAKMDEYQRGLQEQQQVRNLLSQTKTPEEAINVLRSGGFVTQADAIEKGMVARKAQEATSAKTGAEVTAAHYKLMKDMAGVITQDPTPQTAMAVLDDWERHGHSRTELRTLALGPDVPLAPLPGSDAPTAAPEPRKGRKAKG